MSDTGTRYTDEQRRQIVDEVCDRLVEGESIRSICEDEHMPNRKNLYRWFEEDPEFNRRYMQAQLFKLFGHLEQAEDFYNEKIYKINRLPNGAWDSAHVSYLKNKVDEVWRRAAKHFPKKFGELLKIAGDDQQAPIRLDDATRLHRIEAILGKAKNKRVTTNGHESD